ncbi:MAG: hypothetical protein ACT4PL_11005 [Phycisphaerales bacterium]
MVRTDEARECFARAVTFNPALRETAEVLQSGAYNTVLVVDYGQGPRKIGYGMDNALSKFVAWEGFASDGRPLNVRTDAGALSVPVAIDMNAMAADHMWNNLQDVRSAKSIFGTAALATGAVLATSGNRDAQLAGAIVAMVGLFAKAGAHADTRYCEAIPQRVYVVPLRLTGEGTTVELQVGDDQFSRMVLTGLGPPAAPEKVQVRYVRLNHGRVPAGWALSGRPVYRWCGVCPPVEGDGMPFILGGRCVAPPSEEAMSRYQRAGNLPGMLVSDLENLYRAEGITWRVEDEAGKTPLHVLEGGTSLVAPQAGTAGFARLFCQDHEPYKARSKELAETRARLGLR